MSEANGRRDAPRSKTAGMFLAGLWCGLTTGLIVGVRYAEPWWYSEVLHMRVDAFDDAFVRVERLEESYAMESDYFHERLAALAKENHRLREIIEDEGS